MYLKNVLKKNNKKLLFTTPSHGQKFFIFNKLKHLYKYDISETDAYNPIDALERSEKWAANIYGTKYTHYLTNGSTSGIIASVLACTKKGDRVLVWRNAHPSHLNAVELAGCKPIFYDIPQIDGWDIPGRTTPELFDLKDIKAIIVTSPTYEGIVSDIKSLKSYCENNNTYLIVDEAHGALYPFSDRLPQSAVDIADFTIQSLHKTAGGLNPTALLHVNCNIDAKKALTMISTTSPSYPILASIELNIQYLSSAKGKNAIEYLIDNIIEMKKNISNVDFLGDDITKIIIKKTGLSGYELSELLFDKFNIEDEKTNNKSTMLLCGIGTTKSMINKLGKALKSI